MGTLLVKRRSMQRQPDGLTIRTRKWFLGAGFLGALPTTPNRGAHTLAGLEAAENKKDGS